MVSLFLTFSKLQIRDSAYTVRHPAAANGYPQCLLRQERGPYWEPQRQLSDCHHPIPYRRWGEIFFLSPVGSHQCGGAIRKNDAGQTANRCAVPGSHAEKSRFNLALRCHWFRPFGCGEPAEPSRLESPDPQMDEELVTCAGCMETSRGEQSWQGCDAYLF